MRWSILSEQNRKRIPVLLGFLVVSLVAFAQDLPSGKPEAVGLSAERLDRIAGAVRRSLLRLCRHSSNGGEWNSAQKFTSPWRGRRCKQRLYESQSAIVRLRVYHFSNRNSS